MTPEQELANKLRVWKAEPWRFAHEALGIPRIDPGQMDVLRDFVSPDVERIAVLAATGTGKTFIESVCVMWFLTCCGGSSPEDHPKGMATAIDGKNMQMNLWPELAKRIKTSPLMDALFKWQAEKIFLKRHPETWFFEKRTWDAKAASGSGGTTSSALGLAGHHAKNSLFLVDESSGVPKAVLQAGERTLATHKRGEGFRKIFQAGNPTHTSGPLWDAAHGDKKLWNGGRGPIVMTGDPDDPNRSPNVPIEWARGQIEAYGRNDPFVQVYVLGRFPDESFNNFLGPQEVEEAMERDYQISAYDMISPRAGVDVAYDGSDRSWYFPRQGLKAWEPRELKVPLSSPTIGYDMGRIIQDEKRLLAVEDILVDATGGYGFALMEGLRMLGVATVGIKFNQKSSNEAFHNIRTEMYWNMSRWVKRGGALPRVEGLAEELCATKYTIKNGKMLAEPKDLVKKRLQRSPDLADAFILTFAMPDKPRVGLVDPNSIIRGGRMESMMDKSPLDGYLMDKPRQRPTMGWGGNSFDRRA